MLAALARNIDEQPLFGRSDRTRQLPARPSQHLQPLVERRPEVLFVRKYARHHADQLIHLNASRVHQFLVGDGRRVEAAGQDAYGPRLFD